jgi:hypothetical protein
VECEKTDDVDANVQTRSPFIVFHIPDNPALLQAVGVVALRHAHLDHTLKMTIKTLTGVSVGEALAATEYESSSSLRDRIRRLAKRAIGDGTALVRLQALMTRCKSATEKRNELMHSIWGRELDGDPQVRGSDGWRPLPTVEELETLARSIKSLTFELNNERLEGFLAEAMKSKP